MKLTYNPAVFEIGGDVTAARRIILTPEGSTTDERWRIETPYVADLIGRLLSPGPDTVLLDYGCGIGRLARELIMRHGCRVIGVDISTSMRALAPDYVGSDRFSCCSPEEFDIRIGNGLAVDAAYSIWVLQHCALPSADLIRIRRSMKPSGKLFVLNNIHRAVPTAEKGWVNDSVDIRKLIESDFSQIEEGQLPREVAATEAMVRLTYWAAYSRRAGS